MVGEILLGFLGRTSSRENLVMLSSQQTGGLRITG